MYDYLTEEYERENAPQRPSALLWLLLFAITLIVALALAMIVTKSARNAAIDSARLSPCYTTGC